MLLPSYSAVWRKKDFKRASVIVICHAPHNLMGQICTILLCWDTESVTQLIENMCPAALDLTAVQILPTVNEQSSTLISICYKVCGKIS